MNDTVKLNTILEQILEKVNTMSSQKVPIVIAIDGRCASGKTTLAKALQLQCACSVFHVDDFYLPMKKRECGYEMSADGNLDYERIAREILIPIQKGQKELVYQPYSCQKQALLSAIKVEIKPVVVVEGSYCCHPKLWEYYDLYIFVSTENDVQLNRIQKRNGIENAKVFEELWIPMEERYIAEHLDDKVFDLVIHT